MKASGTTELKILFEEPWLVQQSHARLKGDIPLDREWNSLSALGSESGGKGRGWHFGRTGMAGVSRINCNMLEAKRGC